MPNWLHPSSLRGKVDKEVFDVVEELCSVGWKVAQQGHGYRIYCPCTHEKGGRGVSIPGSGSNPGSSARRLRRNAEHCPGSHELMK